MSAGELLDYPNMEALEDIARVLAEMGDADDAARETEDLVRIMRHALMRIEVRAQPLQDIWHAVIWSESGDSGPDGIRRALVRYRAELDGTKE